MNANDMSVLFDRDAKTIRKHINNLFKEEELEEISNTQKMRIANSDKSVAFYTLDVIISVGYRVKSKQGVAFRKWATKLLKDYTLKGYVIDPKRFAIPDLNKITVLLNEARTVSGNIQITSYAMLIFFCHRI